MSDQKGCWRASEQPVGQIVDSKLFWLRLIPPDVNAHAGKCAEVCGQVAAGKSRHKARLRMPPAAGSACVAIAWEAIDGPSSPGWGKEDQTATPGF